MANKDTYKEEVINSVIKLNDGDWIYPCCNSETLDVPSIENENDKDTITQIFCPYGCGYIFVEHYIDNLKQYLKEND